MLRERFWTLKVQRFLLLSMKYQRDHVVSLKTLNRNDELDGHDPRSTHFTFTSTEKKDSILKQVK